MLILCIKTDNPTAELMLYKDKRVIEKYKWLADRKLSAHLLTQIRDLLDQAGENWTDLGGIVLFKGPGSFTGLRIGAAVAQALANSQKIGLVGTTGKQWDIVGVQRLIAGENYQTVQLSYGSEVHITKQKK